MTYLDRESVFARIFGCRSPSLHVYVSQIKIDRRSVFVYPSWCACLWVSFCLFVCECLCLSAHATPPLSLSFSLSRCLSPPSLSLPLSLYVCACVCKNAEERIGFRENRKCSWINKYDSNMKSFIVTFWVTVAPPNFIYLSLCLFVCPPFTACIWITMGLILIKLGGGVGIEVRLIVLRFHKNRLSADVIMTSPLICFALLQRERILWHRAIYLLPFFFYLKTSV